MAQKSDTSAEASVKFDFVRVIRLTALSFVFVALMSAYSSNTQPASPAATSEPTGSHGRTLISEQ